MMRTALIAILLACNANTRPQPDLGTEHVATGIDQRPGSERWRTRYHMRGRQADLDAILAALLAGRLEEARGFARELSRDAGRAPGTTSERLRTTALALAEARTLDEAARITPRVVATCAECHASALPVTTISQLPDDAWDVRTRMLRHGWALRRATDALMSATEESWRSALEVFAAEPLPWLQRTTSHHVQRIARDRLAALSRDTQDDRVRALGEILVTCTRCHASNLPSFGR